MHIVMKTLPIKGTEDKNTANAHTLLKW